MHRRVDDARAVELSTEIARRISDEMTFPGQIKVTVIRESRAVDVAKNHSPTVAQPAHDHGDRAEDSPIQAA